MNALKDLFTKKVKEISADEGLMDAAVSAWGLLLTVASRSAQQDAIERYDNVSCSFSEICIEGNEGSEDALNIKHVH